MSLLNEDTEFYDLYDELIQLDLFTQDELDLVSAINGRSVETLNDCIYARFGYRNFEQMKEEDDED